MVNCHLHGTSVVANSIKARKMYAQKCVILDTPRQFGVLIHQDGISNCIIRKLLIL